jgi:hypothetical protein
MKGKGKGSGDAADAKTDDAEVVVREAPEAEGQSADVEEVAQRSAAQQPGTLPFLTVTTTRPLTLQPSATIFRGSVIAGMPNIQTLFINVTMQI